MVLLLVDRLLEALPLELLPELQSVATVRDFSLHVQHARSPVQVGVIERTFLTCWCVLPH